MTKNYTILKKYNMLLIAGVRCSGKTTALVQLALEDPDGVIIVEAYNQALDLIIKHKIPSYRMNTIKFYNSTGYKSTKPKNLYVDDYDLIQKHGPMPYSPIHKVKAAVITTNLNPVTKEEDCLL